MAQQEGTPDRPDSSVRDRLREGVPAEGAEASWSILHAYVLGQAALGYRTFEPGAREDDLILVSYPKSGSTWMSYLLHQLRSGGDDDFDDIKNEVIDITPGHWDPADNPFTMIQRFHPRTFKTHGHYGLCPKGAKYIYVARDPADVLWSLYLFVHDLFGLEDRVPIEIFYQDYFVDRFGSGHDIGSIWDHLLSWAPHRDDRTVLWLHYEDLVENLPACLTAIASFAGLSPGVETLDRIRNNATMAHMRQISDQLNPSQSNRTGRVTLGFGQEMQRYARRLSFGKLRKGEAGRRFAGAPG